MVAPIGGTQPLGLVRERIPLSVGLGSHTRQVGTAHKCARSSLATLNTVSRHTTRAKQKDHRVMVFLFWLRMLGNEDENNWVLFSPKFSTQSRESIKQLA